MTFFFEKAQVEKRKKIVFLFFLSLHIIAEFLICPDLWLVFSVRGFLNFVLRNLSSSRRSFCFIFVLIFFYWETFSFKECERSDEGWWA